MSKISRLSLWTFLAFGILLLDVTNIVAQDTGDDDAPPGPDYVLTPVGWMHKDCGRVIPDGAKSYREADGTMRIEKDNGEVIERVPVCKHEAKIRKRYSNQAVEGSQIPFNAMVEWSSLTAPTNQWGYNWYNRLDGQWTVPSNPPENGGTIYLWNGLIGTSGGYSALVQPVLQYGPSAAGGGNYWAIASWWVLLVDPAWWQVSTLKSVSVGDVIYGSMYGSGCNNNGTCNQWVITASSPSKSTQLVSGAAGVYVYQYAYQGVLEAYYITTCQRLPGGLNGADYFNNTYLYQPGPGPNSRYEMATMYTWYPWVDTTITPQCNYSVYNVSRGSTLTF